MRARAIREGSVGLLILLGVGLFGGLVLWLRGMVPGSRKYNLTLVFENTSGMQVGTVVRYRGVPVGRVAQIDANSNQIEVSVEITQADLRIPRESRIETNQSGLIGETTIDITPGRPLTETEQALSPTAPSCEDGPIICAGDRIDGQVGVSYEALLRSAETLASTLADPALVDQLKSTLENTAIFAERATALTDELTALTLSAQKEVKPLSNSVQQASNNAAEAAREIQLTAADARSLIAANRFNLTNTLDNINQGSDRLVVLMDTLASEVETSDFLTNLEVLAANAADASVNLRAASSDVREMTGSLNQPENLLLIQQTLESARDVFQSAQKVLSDVDELTGDPTIRNNIRNLINGLSNLLSSTQVLEQQLALAEALAPLSAVATPVTLPVPAKPPQPAPSTDYQQLQMQLEAIATRTSPSGE